MNVHFKHCVVYLTIFINRVVVIECLLNVDSRHTLLNLLIRKESRKSLYIQFSKSHHGADDEEERITRSDHEGCSS